MNRLFFRLFVIKRFISLENRNVIILYIHCQSLFLYCFSNVMTGKSEELLAEFESRMRQLMYLCDSLKEDNAYLRQELNRKDAVIETLTLEVAELKSKYDNLKFVKSFSSEDKEEMKVAKRRLSELVRDVDKCIAILKK